MNLKQTIRRILREETEPNKANLVRKMIYRLYDNVSFIEQSTFNGKPHLRIYFDSDDTAANIESWFDEKISKDIKELTSGFITVCPDWAFHWDSRKKEADVYINTELLRYDNLGNVINESSKYIKRILKEEMSNICNIMSVDNYEEGIELLKSYLGSKIENPKDWEKIEKQLKLWKQQTIKIRREAKQGMSGGTEKDESDTRWSSITSTFCK